MVYSLHVPSVVRIQSCASLTSSYWLWKCARSFSIASVAMLELQGEVGDFKWCLFLELVTLFVFVVVVVEPFNELI